MTREGSRLMVRFGMASHGVRSERPRGKQGGRCVEEGNQVPNGVMTGSEAAADR